MNRLWLILSLLASPAWGASIVLQGDAADSTLTYDEGLYLRTSNGSDSVNYGGQNVLYFQLVTNDTNIALIRFPNVHQANSYDADDIDSAVLELRQNGGDDGVDSVKVHMYEVLKRWDPGGGPSGRDDSVDAVSATYRVDSCLLAAATARCSTRAPDTAWGETGLQAGTDRASSSMDSAWVDSSNTDKWVAWTITKALCSTWVADSASNFGVLLEAPTGQGTYIRDCYSTEAAGTSNDPRLTIYYENRDPATPMQVGPVVFGPTVVGP